MMENENLYPESEEGSESELPSEEGNETALLPLSIFKNDGLKVGDVCSFKVVGIHEGEVEVEKSGESTSSEPPEEMSMDMKIEAAAV